MQETSVQAVFHIMDTVLFGEPCHHCINPMEQTSHVQHRRVFVTIFMITICAAIWGAIFVHLDSLWAAVFPFLMVGACIVAIVHSRTTKTTKWATPILCYGLSFCALGVHWSFGAAHSDNVFGWVLLGPQLAIPLGRSRRETVGFAMLVCACLVVIQILPFACPTTGCRPQQPPVPLVWSQIFSAMNSIAPFIFVFSYITLGWGELQAHQDNLQSTISVAQEICKALVEFDLDGLEKPKDCKLNDKDASSTMIDLLYDLVNNMKAYRPFLPHHLVACPENQLKSISPASSKNTMRPLSIADDEERALYLDPPNNPRPRRTQRRRSTGSTTHSSGHRRSKNQSTDYPTQSGGKQSFSGGQTVNNKAMQAMSNAITVRDGTLAFFAIPNMSLILGCGNPDVIFASEISELFSEIIVGEVQQHNGIVQVLSFLLLAQGFSLFFYDRVNEKDSCCIQGSHKYLHE